MAVDSRNVTSTSLDALTKQNVALVSQLEKASQRKRTAMDKAVDAITAFSGSLHFVWVHLLWFSAWILVNVSQAPRFRFDPYPFQLLTLIVSLEAIFLSAFILITQNRQGLLADRRNHLDLQINLLSEQENTKMLAMLGAIHQHLGIAQNDPELDAMARATRPEKLLDQIDETDGSEREKKPSSSGKRAR